MSSEFQRVVLRTPDQWKAGIALGFEQAPRGGWTLPPTPRFQAWIAESDEREEVEEVTSDGGGRLWWIARRKTSGSRVMRCRAPGRNTSLGLELADLRIEGQVRLRATGKHVWLLDLAGRRILELDAKSRHVIGETDLRGGAEPRDFAATGDTLWILYADQIEQLRAGKTRPFTPRVELEDARAIEARSSRGCTTLVIAEAAAAGLAWIEMDGKESHRPGMLPLVPDGDGFGSIRRLIGLGVGPQASVLALDDAGRAAVYDHGGACTHGILARLAPLRAAASAGSTEMVATDGRRIARLVLDPSAPAARGRYYLRALDSGPSPAALWHRVDFDLDLPPGVGLELRHAFTADAGQRERLDAILARAGSPAGQAQEFERALTLGEDPPWGPPQVLVGGPMGGEAGLAPERGGVRTPVARSLLLRNDERPRVAERGAAGKPLRYLWIRLDAFSLPGGETQRGRTDRPFLLRGLRVVRPRLTWLRYLPAVYQEDEEGRRFLERYLSAFERLFESIEGGIDTLDHDFQPSRVKAARLELLARWMGMELVPEWGEETRRALLAEAGALARAKGTPAALVRFLELVSGRRVRLEESRELPGEVRLGQQHALGSSVLASPEGAPSTLGTARLGERLQGGRTLPPEAAQRARAWRATARLDVPPRELPDAERERIERWLRGGAPAHVETLLGGSSSGDMLFRVGDLVRDRRPVHLGGGRLGGGLLASSTVAARLGRSRLNPRFSLDGRSFHLE